jgi:DNA-binding NarL/FixJ family response regulator
MTVAGQALDGQDAVEQFRQCRPDVTLLDLQMPRMNGIEATSAIRELDPQARIIVLTTYSGDVQAVRALRAGALGYLLKGSLGTDLIAAIRDVAQGKRRVPIEVACSLAENLSTDWLTAREIEVLRAVARGSANKCIAGVLGITEDTVKGHMRSILSKLHANDRTHAVMIALKRGFLEG